ncbi:MAG TPA: 16S rRNA (uracil(1498)-N(3))-methyltransferase [Mycobacteriales bacterium]|nr:16S rRNA (uracil(1498)-N(3))-methyltransferase [Mycobacteriales bacterium]
MTAPVFHAPEISGDVLMLTGTEGHHAATVRRVRPGEEVHLVDGRGTRVECSVRAVAPDEVELAVVRRYVEPAPQPRIVVVQGLAKGDRGELAVALATEVGADEIVPWQAARSIVVWEGERGQRALRRWRATAHESAKQSRRAWWPEVPELATTSDIAARLAEAAGAFVLHESATAPLAAAALPLTGEVVLVIGPEGGITEDELAAFGAAGAAPVRLGQSILRTSTAGAAAVAVVSARTPRWS